MVKEWLVRTIVHKDTGLRIAISDDLPGLYVHGETDEEIEERVLLAIRALLEAKGEKVGEILRRDDDDDLPESFSDPVSRYSAEACYA